VEPQGVAGALGCHGSKAWQGCRKQGSGPSAPQPLSLSAPSAPQQCSRSVAKETLKEYVGPDAISKTPSRCRVWSIDNPIVGGVGNWKLSFRFRLRMPFVGTLARIVAGTNYAELEEWIRSHQPDCLEPVLRPLNKENFKWVLEMLSIRAMDSLSSRKLVHDILSSSQQSSLVKREYYLTMAKGYRDLIGTGAAIGDDRPRRYSYDCYMEAVRADPKNGANPGYLMIGETLMEMSQYTQAAKFFGDAISQQPDVPQLYLLYANVCQKMGEMARGVQAMEQGLQVCGDKWSWKHRKSYLGWLNYIDRDRDEVSKRHLEYAEASADTSKEAACPVPKDKDPHRILKIAYLSTDLKEHVVGYCLEGVFRAHNRSQVHVTIYQANPKDDSRTEALKLLADSWIKVADMDDKAVADQIRADEIDILIEINGLTAGSRVDVLAHRPAPIQVAWLGYPNTTGKMAEWRKPLDRPSSQVHHLMLVPNRLEVH